MQRAFVSEHLRGRGDAGEGKSDGRQRELRQWVHRDGSRTLAATVLEFWNLEIAANLPGEKIREFDVSGNSFGRAGLGVGPERVCGPFALENTTV